MSEELWVIPPLRTKGPSLDLPFPLGSGSGQVPAFPENGDEKWVSRAAALKGLH
ncbi:uncharacterized protein GLRG_03367 [Colletotrichum graminicola M1.001]|uniref:Uncharacterized protein n=1 Tax=Colletotrichum graminicola (strain M1.001 / M2 / FGSC 10212) TaxID=645133 RepID=E3QBY8_COLGM|nr:uncharacterized protein GLRG_03367 [Colletotrichum graminicola M1.001]EFQ28223.1 hypothetical protein GLRG_03367 [Colletotrichum graminicola M1.001]